LSPEDVASREWAQNGGLVPKGRPVAIGGRQATLYEDRPRARLELTIAGTYVTIHGEDQAQVVQAAQSLKKVN
jgi:hypothetical protein